MLEISPYEAMEMWHYIVHITGEDTLTLCTNRLLSKGELLAAILDRIDESVDVEESWTDAY